MSINNDNNNHLSMKDLIDAFDSYWARSSKFIGVLVSIAGAKEVIINSRENFDEKLLYYQQAYDENLFHKKADNIRIINFTFADTYEEIQSELINNS